MSHRDSCPSDYEARREGERAGERGYSRNPYRETLGERYCEEAERNWDRGQRAGAEIRREEEMEEARKASQRQRVQAEQEEYEYPEHLEQQDPEQPYPDEEPREVESK